MDEVVSMLQTQVLTLKLQSCLEFICSPMLLL